MSVRTTADRVVPIETLPVAAKVLIFSFKVVIALITTPAMASAAICLKSDDEFKTDFLVFNKVCFNFFRLKIESF